MHHSQYLYILQHCNGNLERLFFKIIYLGNSYWPKKSPCCSYGAGAGAGTGTGDGAGTGAGVSSLKEDELLVTLASEL